MKKLSLTFITTTSALLTVTALAGSVTRILPGQNQLDPVAYTSANKSDVVSIENLSVQPKTMLVTVDRTGSSGGAYSAVSASISTITDKTIQPGSSAYFSIDAHQTLILHSVDEKPTGGTYQFDS